MREWRLELDDLIARGREMYGDDEVRDALTDVLEGLGSDSMGQLRPPVAVLGVRSCAAGWVGVLVRPSGHTTLHLGATLAVLVEQVREQESLGAVGLADATGQSEAIEWLQTRPTVDVVEVSGSEGDAAARRAALASKGVTVPPFYAGMGFAEEDLLAACEAASEAAHLWS